MKMRFTEDLTLKMLSPGRESPKAYMNCWTESVLEPMCRKSRAWGCGRVCVPWIWFVWVWAALREQGDWTCLVLVRLQSTSLPSPTVKCSQIFCPQTSAAYGFESQVYLCSSTLILNRPCHCLCGGIVFKANCLCFLLLSRESVCQDLKLYMRKR